MAFSVEWLVEGRVILASVSGDADAEMGDRVTNALVEFLDHGKSPQVHLVFDASALEKYLVSFVDTAKLTNRYIRHPLLGWFILISTNKIINFLGAAVMSTMKVRFRVVGSREEAIAFLREMDSTVADALRAG
jgi:hypothetical protein